MWIFPTRAIGMRALQPSPQWLKAKVVFKSTRGQERCVIQDCRNAVFIFSGSQKSMMSEMFSSPARPFYQSVALMFLKPVCALNLKSSVRTFIHRKPIQIVHACPIRKIHKSSLPVILNRISNLTDVWSVVGCLLQKLK